MRICGKNKNVFRSYSTVKLGLLVLSTLAFLYFVTRSTFKKDPPGMNCYEDIFKQKTVCSPICKQNGYFSFPGMEKCAKWLSCDQIKNEINTIDNFAHGFFKNVSWVSWRNHDLARSVQILQDRYLMDENFKNNIKMIKLLNPSPYIIQLVGLCGDKEILTEYYPFQTLAQIHILLRAKLRSYNNIKTRMYIAINFVKIIQFLHKYKDGPLILCDSCVLSGYLKQFLVTNDFHVVLSDLDSLKKLDRNKMVICDCSIGDIQAPEEDLNTIIRITEKRDIWRIPFVVNFILGTNNTFEISHELHRFHKQCMLIDPWERPSIDRVVRIYEKIYNSL